MDEKELKTSTKQRVFIILIAILMVGSIIASYAAIVINGSQSGSSNNTSEVDEAKIAELTEQYEAKQQELAVASEDDFQRFVSFKSEIKGYNETSANENGLQTKDLLDGSGDKVTSDNYLAYYIGWCADEKVFDSSLDNSDNPKSFKSVLDPSVGLIEGWTKGVEGMKLGGIREITIPSELAYKDSDVACGANKPLKFMVMAIPRKGVPAELVEIQTKLQYAYYGIDYDSVSANEE